MKARIAAEVLGDDPLKFSTAIDGAIARRFSFYQEGIKKYQNAEFVNKRKAMPTVWTKGSASLLSYRKEADDYPLFVIPSLVNRYYILDLLKENSFLRWLANEGWGPYVMDWGHPGPAESNFGLEDYIVQYLLPALKEVEKRSGKKPIVIGYCMGGTLATALSVLAKPLVKSLVLIVSPWDFHEKEDQRAIQQGRWLQSLLPWINTVGHFSGEGLQSLFASLDPTLSLRKFLNFRQLDVDTEQAKVFISLEDWLNDGVSLTQKVACECLQEWYGENLTEKGHWVISGEKVTLDKVRVPTLSVVSDNDRIVPKASSLALSAGIDRSTLVETPLGHIGIMVSRNAQSKVWNPIVDWMEQFRS